MIRYSEPLFSVMPKRKPSEQSLAALPVGSLIKFMINNSYRHHIVVQHGKPSSIYDDSFDGATILLMKDIYENRQWHSSDVNNYAGSTIHSYLNNAFYNQIDAKVQAKIKQVKIPYRPGSGTSMTVNSGANGLPAYVWLLGGYEVNWTSSTNPYFPADGARLAYFTGTATTDAKRIAYLNGTASRWWFRSPVTANAISAWNVLPTGDSNQTNCVHPFGVRPALVFPGDTLVSLEPDIDGAYIVLTA